MDIQAIQAVLPHRYPFLLVDRVDSVTADKIVARKMVTANEPFFAGHFPGHPIMPGVLIVEALAQAGALLVAPQVGFDPARDAIFLMSHRQGEVPQAGGAGRHAGARGGSAAARAGRCGSCAGRPRSRTRWWPRPSWSRVWASARADAEGRRPAQGWSMVFASEARWVAALAVAPGAGHRLVVPPLALSPAGRRGRRGRRGAAQRRRPGLPLFPSRSPTTRPSRPKPWA